MAKLMRMVGNDGVEVLEVTPKSGSAFTLEELQEFVGGNIEVIRSHNLIMPAEAGKYFGNTNPDMIINEDGRNLDLPINPIASAFYAHCKLEAVRMGRMVGLAIIGGEPIVGNAVLVSQVEMGEANA